MPKKIEGGVLSDDAAQILAALTKDGKRGAAISDALLEYGSRRGITINQGWFNGSFNNWLSNNRFWLAFKAVVSPLTEGIPKPIWIFGGAVGGAGLVVLFLGLLGAI